MAAVGRHRAWAREEHLEQGTVVELFGMEGAEWGIIEEYEAERAEGGGVEPEDAGGTEHAVDAAEADVVEEEGPPAPPFLSLVSPPTVAALRSFFSSTSVGGWEVHLGGIRSSGF